MPTDEHPLTLTDSGLETELVFLDGVDLPEFAAFPLLADAAGRERLTRYFAGHLDVAEEAGLPLLLETPTWRASAAWGDRLGYDAEALAALNARSVDLLREVRDSRPATVPVTVSGQLGPRGDGYDASLRSTPDDAQAYHRPQLEAFAAARADQATALTMTHVEEAVGLARAARAVGLPVVLSFTVETDGRLPSGDTLGAALTAVEDATDAYPLLYGLNCAHPDHLGRALADAGEAVGRIGLLRANASRLSHAELDAATELDDGDPVELGGQLVDLRRRYPHLRVLGGCCGTDVRHVRAIAAAAAGSTTSGHVPGRPIPQG